MAEIQAVDIDSSPMVIRLLERIVDALEARTSAEPPGTDLHPAEECAWAFKLLDGVHSKLGLPAGLRHDETVISAIEDLLTKAGQESAVAADYLSQVCIKLGVSGDLGSAENWSPEDLTIILAAIDRLIRKGASLPWDEDTIEAVAEALGSAPQRDDMVAAAVALKALAADYSRIEDMARGGSRQLAEALTTLDAMGAVGDTLVEMIESLKPSAPGQDLLGSYPFVPVLSRIMQVVESDPSEQKARKTVIIQKGTLMRFHRFEMTAAWEGSGRKRGKIVHNWEMQMRAICSPALWDTDRDGPRPTVAWWLGGFRAWDETPINPKTGKKSIHTAMGIVPAGPAGLPAPPPADG